MTFYGVLTPVQRPILLENDVILHLLSASYTPSYTLSYTRNPQQTQGIFAPWCRNVGYFQKTFLGERHLKRFHLQVGKSKTSDFFATNCRTFMPKHRNFPSKKSDVFHRKKTKTTQTYRRKRSIVSVSTLYTEEVCFFGLSPCG